MHQYTVEKSRVSRQKVTIILVIFSIILCTLINSIYDRINTIYPNVFNDINIFLSKWPFLGFSISPISMFAIFKILDALFNSFIWKLKSLNKILGVTNFSGEWEGHCESSFKSDKDIDNNFTVKVTIKQTWKQIFIESVFAQSVSVSDTACIRKTDNRIELKFTYINSPNKTNDKEVKTGDNKLFSKYHDGTNVLYLDVSEKNNEKLNGYYFNYRGNTGTMELIRCKNKKSKS